MRGNAFSGTGAEVNSDEGGPACLTLQTPSPIGRKSFSIGVVEKLPWSNLVARTLLKFTPPLRGESQRTSPRAKADVVGG